MGPFLILVFVIQFFSTTTLSKVLNAPLSTVNSINDKFKDYSLLSPWEVSNENDEFRNRADALAEHIGKNGEDVLTDDDDDGDVFSFADKTELQFHQPIESVNVDYPRNAVILKFYKNNANSVMELEPIENANKKPGKRSYEAFSSSNSLDGNIFDKNRVMRLERSQQTARDSRGDNFMRFGRSDNVKNDFMRFGRGASDFMRFGRTPSQDYMRFGRASEADNFMRFGRAAGPDFMRFGRAAGQDFMRFGRAPSQDFMRFGRTPSQDFIRFGRSPSQDFMRFGRTPSQDFMRFGRNSHENFMRFGRDSLKMPKNTNFMRYSRPDNFMRFGRTPQLSDNFIRFGKSMEILKDKNDSQPLEVKNELKQAVKLIHEADKNDDSENPVDKAIKVLFDKHQQQDPNDKARSDELNGESSYQHNGSNNLDSTDSELF